ncbi:Man1-Src1p-C-terminal domain-containing protein [Amylocystis lapponica]|nr:Man1-Src1p-C-terminal domain-containing protein [Amylocystis lapponica]
MSRITAAQVVALGEYLDPDFDPASLTVAQLLGVFNFHNVIYPSQYTKPKLIQLFNEEIKAKSRKLKRERIKRENSQASDDGIKDGVTGKLINEGNAPVRRSSRRASRTPSQEQVVEPEPAPTKRRRSSAQPSLGGPTRRKTTKPAEPVLVEESEPEEEVVVRKVGRKKKGTTDAGTQSRRVSQSFPEDSGWEDNNIFQSAAESSSPARPSPVRHTRRSSAAPRPTLKSRKSMSAPPQYLSSSPTRPEPEERELPRGSRASSVRPPESNFEPRLPPGTARAARATVAKATRNTLVPEALGPKRVVVRANLKEETQEVEEEQQIQALRNAIAETAPEALTEVEDASAEQEGGSEDEGEFDAEADQVTAVSRRIAEGGRLVRRTPASNSGAIPSFLRILFALFSLLGSGMLYQYKQESAPIGFCDTGTPSNAILDGIRSRSSAVQSCNLENRTALYLISDPNGLDSGSWHGTVPAAATRPPAASGHLHALPPSCHLHAVHDDLRERLHSPPAPPTLLCFRPWHCHVVFDIALHLHPPFSHVNPEHGFLSPRLLYLVNCLDGLPGLGPVALPPRCVEDPRRKRHIGVLGKAVEAMLAAERGHRLCEGVAPLGKLKEDLKRKTAPVLFQPSLMGTLDDTFNEAIQQLVQWGGVFMGEDADGKRYLAHRTPVMSWDCVLTVKARDAWAEWKQSIIGSAVLLLSVLAFRRQQVRNLVESKRVSELVQVALDTLRSQETAHHVDPVTVPRPYLSSLQLRDLVLQDEHSVSARRRLWERVERVVEGNANVRTNLEEVEGGDELRVWRWVGSAGQPRSPGAGPEKGGGRIVA